MLIFMESIWLIFWTFWEIFWNYITLLPPKNFDHLRLDAFDNQLLVTILISNLAPRHGPLLDNTKWAIEFVGGLVAYIPLNDQCFPAPGSRGAPGGPTPAWWVTSRRGGRAFTRPPPPGSNANSTLRRYTSALDFWKLFNYLNWDFSSRWKLGRPVSRRLNCPSPPASHRSKISNSSVVWIRPMLQLYFLKSAGMH